MSGNSWWADCHTLSIAFANNIDRRRYDEVAALFTEDGIIDRWDQKISGRAAIRSWLDTRPTNIVTRHVCTNFEARVSATNHADGFTLFTFFRAKGADDTDGLLLSGPDMVGEYSDQFRLTPDGWRIAKRAIRIVFKK